MKGLDFVESHREPPIKLINDLEQGKVILYVGSNFLEPSRYQKSRSMMSLIDAERSIEKASEVSKLANIAKSVRKDYSSLKSFCEDTWPVEKYDGLIRLVNRFPKTKSIVTTIFDTNIMKALRKTKYHVREITAIERITNDSYRLPETPAVTAESEIVLYQLLGSLDKPYTLRLTDDSLYELRREFRSLLGNKSLESRFRDFTLLLLGYNNEDMFDPFFKELINDLTSESQLPRNDIYFVDKLGYDTTYGLWSNEEIDAKNIIAMTPTHFIEEIT